ncbi:hypothetical protein D3OALGB2SA_1792 [Olavius algarvensis associated proteobacterium Delta 3]|nr:hypothetical protein D3OALGB2SA_1792 [Olavius algarvensis associated proteobacterium Delta 3]
MAGVNGYGLWMLVAGCLPASGGLDAVPTSEGWLLGKGYRFRVSGVGGQMLDSGCSPPLYGLDT